MATFTFGTLVDPAHYVETPDVANPGQVKRPDAGVTLLVKDGSSLADLTPITTLSYGYWTYATTDIPTIVVSGDGGTTWVGPLIAIEAQLSASIDSAAASGAAAAALSLAQSTAATVTALQGTVAGKLNTSAAPGIVQANIQTDPATMTRSVNQTTGVVTLGVIPTADALTELSDVTVDGAVQGQQLTKMPDGSWGAFGLPTLALPVGTSIPSTYPRPLEVIYYSPAPPPNRYTLAHGTAGASVTAVLESMSADTTNKAVYIADGVVPTGQARVARFTPTGQLMYLAQTGLTWGTLFCRFFINVESVTGNLNIVEVRSATDALSVLQIQATGQIQVKNKATTVYTTTTALTAGTGWYRLDGKVGASSQRWRLYSGNSGTILEDSGDVGAFAGAPGEIRIGHTVGTQANGVTRMAALDLSDQSLSTPWS